MQCAVHSLQCAVCSAQSAMNKVDTSQYARRRAFITITRTITDSVYQHDFESPWLWGTAIGHFHFRNNETEDMLVRNTLPEVHLSVRKKNRTHLVKT